VQAQDWQEMGDPTPHIPTGTTHHQRAALYPKPDCHLRITAQVNSRKAGKLRRVKKPWQYTWTRGSTMYYVQDIFR